MPIAPSLITNLSLGGIGLVSAGGLAYGGYELLKDRPRAMSEFLSSQKKVALSQDPEKDKDEWKANWNKYLEKYGPKPKAPSKPKVAQAPLLDPEPSQEPEIKDVWGLATELKTNSKDVPPARFKEKCKEEGAKQISGTWSKDFDDYLNYCTKHNTEED